MEPLGQRRSKICVPDRGRTPPRGGNWWRQRDGNMGNLSPGHSSCSSCTLEEDSRYSKPSSVPNGMPINKLLPNEMLPEAEVRRQSPGVITRLMGLEGVPSPPQQTSGRSQKRQVEDLHRKRKVEKTERSGNISSRGSSRRSSKDELEFKDVFEDTEWSKLRSCDYVVPKNVEPVMDKGEMVFIRQKFLDAKWLSTDDELQNSMNFDDSLEMLNSNKDLLLKFLQQPDPLFSNNVRDRNTFEPNWSKNVTVRKRVNAQDCETIPHSSNSLRENVLRKHGKPFKNYQNGVPSRTPIALDGTSYKSTRREHPAAPYSFPTRIVVLKPHLEKGEDTPETIFSPSRQSLFPDFDIPPEFLGVKSSETKLVDRKSNPDQSKKSRGISRKVRVEARSTSSGIRSVSVPSSRHKVSARDEISSSMSLDAFAYDSDGGAKRRMSERCELAHKPFNKGEFSQGSTPAEMFAIPDRLVRYTDLQKVGQEGLKGVSDTSARTLCMSSRDDCKDVGLGKLSRSRSLPGSSTLIRSSAPRYPRTSRSHHTSCDFVETIPREVAGWEKHSPMKENISTMNNLVTGKFKYPSNHSLSPSCRSDDVSSEFVSTCGQFASRPKEIVQSTQGAVEEEAIVNPSPSNTHEASLQQIDASEWFLDELLSKELSRLVPENYPVAAHCSIPEPYSSQSSKEADQPSPVSVLESTFADDFCYSSQCFESLSADLHGLRIQLELLKPESRAYAEGSEFILGDDKADGLFHPFEGREFHKPSENWEFSYVADMLMAFGYLEWETDHFITKWHLPDCPAGPSVFEQLEKTYASHNSSISERKLLFDLINLTIQEVHQPLMDLHSLLKPAAEMVHANWRKDSLLETLMSFVRSHEKNAGKEVMDKAFISETKWLNSSKGIDLMGEDLGNLLETELIDELLAV